MVTEGAQPLEEACKAAEEQQTAMVVVVVAVTLEAVAVATPKTIRWEEEEEEVGSSSLTSPSQAPLPAFAKSPLFLGIPTSKVVFQQATLIQEAPLRQPPLDLDMVGKSLQGLTLLQVLKAEAMRSPLFIY
jgi:hypothetical protein